jgi:hypothetical protein
MARHGTLTRRAAKEQPATCATTRPPLHNIHNNIPLPVLAPIIPFPDSDRCDTAGVHVHPPRRSSPAISRFCPTLGWLNLVKSVSHRAAAHVALAAPIVLYDMWSRAEDNVLVQTISTKIRLNSYNPDLDVFWNLVAEEITGRLPQQCRACYMPAAFLAQLTWGFLRISVGRVPCAPACASNASRSKGNDTPSLCYSLTHAHRSIGYRNIPQPLADSAARLMYLRVYDSRASFSKPAPSPSSLYYSLTLAHSIHPPTPPTPTATRLTIISTRATQCMRGV